MLGGALDNLGVEQGAVGQLFGRRPRGGSDGSEVAELAVYGVVAAPALVPLSGDGGGGLPSLAGRSTEQEKMSVKAHNPPT